MPKELSDIDKLLNAEAAGKSPQIIDLNSAAQPAVLAGLFHVSPAMIYQYRQKGWLPPNSDATYRESLEHYIQFLKTKAGGRAASLREALDLENLRLVRAKTEREWLTVMEERKQLVDREALAEVFEPLFVQTKSQFASLLRKHPEVAEDVNHILETWQKIGEKMAKLAAGELENLVDEQMEHEPELDEEVAEAEDET